MSLSHDPCPRISADCEDELYELLKEGEATENNEGSSTKGETVLYPDPLGREAGNADAPWGEKGHPDPSHNSTGVWEGHKKTRSGVLSNTFSGFGAAQAAARATISQNFNTKDYGTHSAVLEKKAAMKMAEPRQLTLLERVKRVTGRP